MRHSEFDIQNPMDDGEPEVAWPGKREERVDRFGIRTALLALVIALFVAAMWLAKFRQSAIPQGHANTGIPLRPSI